MLGGNILIYIAFDQASTTSGFSIYKNRELVDFGKFKGNGPFFDRAHQLQEEVVRIVEETRRKYPKESIKIGLEEIQMQGNVETFKRLAQLQGILILTIKQKFSMEPELISASTWKSFNQIKGRGRTEQKRNAQNLVEELYGMRPTQDESDAIMIGRYMANKEMNWG